MDPERSKRNSTSVAAEDVKIGTSVSVKSKNALTMVDLLHIYVISRIYTTETKLPKGGIELTIVRVSGNTESANSTPPGVDHPNISVLGNKKLRSDRIHHQRGHSRVSSQYTLVQSGVSATDDALCLTVIANEVYVGLCLCVGA